MGDGPLVASQGGDAAGIAGPGDAAGLPGPGDAAGIAAFLAFYDDALPHVFGYLSSRCGGSRPLAEDLTAETFLAVVDAAGRGTALLTVPWAIGVARHKLADHWRRQERAERYRHLVTEPADGSEDPWECRLDAVAVQRVLQDLPPQHRAALTLRYLDDLPVPEVAALLGRTVHATEALLVRARAAFRRASETGEVPGA